MFFTDKEAENTRERSGAAGMGHADAAVARDHDPRLPVKSFDVGFDHGVTDDTGFRAGCVAFADDANVHLNGRKIIGFGEFGERVAGVGGVGLELGYGEVIGSAEIGNGFFDAGGILVLLVGDDDLDVGRPGFVGV